MELHLKDIMNSIILWINTDKTVKLSMDMLLNFSVYKIVYLLPRNYPDIVYTVEMNSVTSSQCLNPEPISLNCWCVSLWVKLGFWLNLENPNGHVLVILLFYFFYLSSIYCLRGSYSSCEEEEEAAVILHHLGSYFRIDSPASRFASCMDPL